MSTEEPIPIGIPNRIGNTCWFQSATQCIFRNPEFRNKINSFDPSILQIKNDQSTLECLKELQKHFLSLSKPNLEVDNSTLVSSLEVNQRKIFDKQTSSGKDSFIALEAFFELFSTLLGDFRPDFHSFNSPLGSLQMMKSTQQTSTSSKKLMSFLYITLQNQQDNKASFLQQIDSLFFLPDVLVMRQDKTCKERTHPEPYLNLPEPFDYIACGKDLSKCKSEVKYQLFGVICYQGTNADHAIALIKLVNNDRWYQFNDQTVTEKGDDSILSNEQVLSTDFTWPALFFYRKLK